MGWGKYWLISDKFTLWRVRQEPYLCPTDQIIRAWIIHQSPQLREERWHITRPLDGMHVYLSHGVALSAEDEVTVDLVDTSSCECLWVTNSRTAQAHGTSVATASRISLIGISFTTAYHKGKKKNYIRGGTTNQYLLPFTAYNIACVVVVPYTSDTNPWVIYNYVWYQQLAWEFEP